MGFADGLINFFDLSKFAKNYNAKYIRTGSGAPLFHFMAVIMIGGIAVEYVAHQSIIYNFNNDFKQLLN